jgi:hypothetical protein
MRAVNAGGLAWERVAQTRADVSAHFSGKNHENARGKPSFGVEDQRSCPFIDPYAANEPSAMDGLFRRATMDKNLYQPISILRPSRDLVRVKLTNSGLFLGEHTRKTPERSNVNRSRQV